MLDGKMISLLISSVCFGIGIVFTFSILISLLGFLFIPWNEALHNILSSLLVAIFSFMWSIIFAYIGKE